MPLTAGVMSALSPQTNCHKNGPLAGASAAAACCLATGPLAVTPLEGSRRHAGQCCWALVEELGRPQWTVLPHALRMCKPSGCHGHERLGQHANALMVNLHCLLMGSNRSIPSVAGNQATDLAEVQARE